MDFTLRLRPANSPHAAPERPAARGNGRLLKWATASLATLGLGVWVSVPAAQQPGPPRGAAAQVPLVAQFDGGSGTDEPVTDSSLFVSDRALAQRLDKARELLGQSRYSEATRFLDSVLASPQDFFFQPDKSQPVFASLKTESQNLIGKLPRAGREAYELQFGAQAEQLLVDALAGGDWQGAAEVGRRFFHTQAGYQAAYLTGCQHLDEGRPLSAAMCLAPLAEMGEVAAGFEPGLSLSLASGWLRAGMPEEARRVLRTWAERQGRTVSVGGRTLSVFHADQDPIAWLQNEVGVVSERPVAKGPSSDWLVHRGNAARNGSAQGSPPILTARWRVRTSNDPLLEEILQRLGGDYRDRGLSALPGLQPLVIGDRVVVRTATALGAVNFRTGKWLWESASSAAPEQSWTGRSSWTSARLPTQMEWGIEQRMWDDATFGTLSSDGKRVYCVEDLSLGPGLGAMPTAILANLRRRSGATVARTENRLAAYDLATGRLEWELGGPSGEEELGQAGSFFLGAPLPVGGELFVLAEKAGEIRLLVLDGATGRLGWSQQLAVVEDSVVQHRPRRMGGASPSYAQGVLVCPTVAGAVVAVDLTRRTLLWGYQYPRPLEAERQELMGPGVALGRLMSAGPDGPGERWLDSTVLIADGRVLITPVETNELHCLDLTTGRVLWKAVRGDGLYLAGVDQGRVLVVGRGQLRSLALDDGTEQWPTSLALPQGSQPSGRGVWTDNHGYLLPLTSREIAVIDLEGCRIASRVASRGGDVPGNLLAHQGSILSQGVDALSCYPELAALEATVASQLAANPQDPRALAAQGEVLLEQGHWVAAAQALRASLAQRDRPATRELLVAVLLEGLRRDFSAFREASAELEQLVERPEDRAAYLRSMAAGWQGEGKHLEAFRVYLRLAEPVVGPDDLEQVDESRQVRRDRWVRAELESLFELATPADREAMQTALAQRLGEALEQPGPAALRRFLQFFAGSPLASQARWALAERLDPEHDALELEFLLRRLSRGEPSDLAAQALWRLAELVAQRGRTREALPLRHRLKETMADRRLQDGRTVGEHLAALVESAAPEGEMPTGGWPRGAVELSKSAGAQPTYQRANLSLRGPIDEGQADLLFEWDQARQGQPLVALDGSGRELWQQPLIELHQRVGYEFTPLYNHAQLEGHLVLLSIGRRILAIDGWSRSAADGERILWSQDTSDALPGTPGTQLMQTQALQLDWGTVRTTVSDGYGRPLAMFGPVSEDLLIVPRHRSLTALDPRTGEVLWTRQQMPAGCECFGDDELIFALPIDSSEAIVLRAWDGRELGTRRLPSVAERVACRGRHVLAWTAQGDGQRRLHLVDAWSGAELWQRTVAEGSKADLVEEDRLAVLEPEGKFWVLRIADGTVEIEADLPETPELTELLVVPSAEQYVVVANRPQTEGTVWLRAIPGGTDSRLVHGLIAGFERSSGKLLWTRQVERQAMVTRQPRDLPVLVLACHVYERPVAGGRQNRNHVAILCLDKRTGRPAYQDRLQAGLSGYALTANFAEASLSLRLLRETVTMKFTDRPPPDEAGGAAAGEEAGQPRQPGDVDESDEDGPGQDEKSADGDEAAPQRPAPDAPPVEGAKDAGQNAPEEAAPEEAAPGDHATLSPSTPRTMAPRVFSLRRRLEAAPVRAGNSRVLLDEVGP